MNGLIESNAGVLTTTSKIVSDVFGKPHRDVMKAIVSMYCSEEFKKNNYTETTYKTDRGKVYKCYNMTENGALFLCMGFTGVKSALKKEVLIKLISESVLMEKALQIVSTIDVDDPDMYIYVMRASVSGAYKIGISKNPEERIKSISVGNHEEIELIHKWVASEGFKSEALIHKVLSAYSIRGEWFNGSAPVLDFVGS